MRLVVSLLVFFTIASGALAHDHWINAGGYRSPVDGVLCCGEHDCAVVEAESVRLTAAGYMLRDGEIVPFREALPSEDGQYHRCHKPDGSRRCFFAPMPGS